MPKNYLPADFPLAYLITFTCYGTHLHGSAQGSVDRNHRAVGADLIPPNGFRLARDRKQMPQAPYFLDGPRRRIVLKALHEVCEFRGWRLLGAHIRSTHVHSVVEARSLPEKVMNSFKAYASRALNSPGIDSAGRRRWTRHGSTQYLWTPQQVEAAIRYVLEEQGDPMVVFDGRRKAHEGCAP